MKKMIAAVVLSLFAFGSAPAFAADDTTSGTTAGQTAQKAKKKTKRAAKKTKKKTKKVAKSTARRTGVDRNDAQLQGKH
jgi:hypothetical protein